MNFISLLKTIKQEKFKAFLMQLPAASRYAIHR